MIKSNTSSPSGNSAVVSPVTGLTFIQSGNSCPSGINPSYFTTSLFVSLKTLKDILKLFLPVSDVCLKSFSATKSTSFKPSDNPVLVSIFKASIELLSI